MSPPLPHSYSQPERFLYFVLNSILPAAPPVLWWSTGLGLFSLLNLVFEREIWPHTPRAENWFLVLGICCAVLLPWQVARTAGRVAETLRGSAWRLLWQLTSWGAYAAGAVVLIPGTLGACYLVRFLLLR